MLRTLLAAALAVGFCTSAAQAHDQWANGDPVPAWVKSECCGAEDVHHLRPDQVHVVPGGYKLDGYDTPIPEKILLPSPDGDWWVFYRVYPDGSQGRVYCFFGPPQAF